MTTDNDLQQLPMGELEQLLDETDASIKAVRDELQRRRAAEQHLAIDQLEERLAAAKPKWAEVKSFFELVLQELRK